MTITPDKTAEEREREIYWRIETHEDPGKGWALQHRDANGEWRDWMLFGDDELRCRRALKQEVGTFEKGRER